MIPFLASLAVIAAAELGDKSQLLALAFAARFRAGVVLAGIAAATLISHLGSVVLGRAIGIALPMDVVYVLAGASFIAYGLWTVRGDHLDGDLPGTSRYGPFVTIAVAFFVAELGDKTQLATVSLATRYDAPVEVWIGSTVGMIAADAVAIVLGVYLGRRLPERTVKIAAAALFLVFGGLTMAAGLR